MLRVLAGSFPLIVIASLLAAAPEAAKPLDHPRGYVCPRASGPVAIDGVPDEAAWAAAAWSDPFVDIEGDAKPKPRFRTRMKMIYDDEALYIAAELEEPHVWAKLKEHDAILFMDPDFEVFLDPDGDNHHYGELEINANNATWDLLLTKPYKDGGRALNGWEIIGLKTAVKVNGTLNDPTDKDVGWTVEIKWPWKGLNELVPKITPPKEGDQWRINFSRVEWDFTIVNGQYVKVPKKPEYNWVWSPQGAIDMHRPERWGYIQFGAGAFKPDPTAPTRDLLHKLYYAQRDYKKAHGNYAATTAELGLAETVPIVRTANGYEALFNKLTIREDSLIK